MLERGRYGVEWTTRPKRDDSPGLGRIVALVVVLALVSLVWTAVKRIRAARQEAVETPPAVDVAPSVPASEPPVANEPVPPPLPRTVGASRPPKVRNLLMRLEVAEQRRDVEMAVTTIEQIRALPGSPAADLDDALARRLGTLNLRRLFTLKCAQWVTQVTVKSGEAASRIAAERGSTLASLVKLNGGKIDALRPGQQLYVLDHPRFTLVVRRRTRTADLQLNGKFFKRYDLMKEATGADGAYELSFPVRPFWKTVGVEFKATDRAELELLMPKGASVLVSEL